MNIENSTEAPERRPGAPASGPGGFGAALRYEWTSLRTLRSPWVLSVLGVLLQLVYALMDGSREGSTGFEQFSNGLSLTTLITAVLVAAIGVNAFGSEYRYRTITTTVLVTRSPARVVLAKAAVVAGIGAVTGLLALLVDWLGVLILGGTVPDPAPTAVAGLGAITYLVLFGLIGLALAGLTRHAVLALGAVILWSGGLETAIGGVLDLPSEVMPALGAKQAAISSDPQLYLALPLVGVTAVLLAGAVAALSRRDT